MSEIVQRLTSYRFNAHADRGDVNDRIYSPPEGVKLPDAANLSAWRAPLRDQGEEGACTAFTGRGAMEFLRAKKGHPYLAHAPQHLYHNELIVENGTARHDTGCSIRTIPKTLNKFGICEEALWPYEKRRFSTNISKRAAANGFQYTVSEYYRVPSLYALRYALAVDKLCVLIGVSVYASMMTDETARSGIVPVPSKSDKMVGGHALLCDGYDATGRWGSGMFYFGPNSWGDTWGGANDAPTAAGARRGIYYLPEQFVASDDCLSDVWVLMK